MWKKIENSDYTLCNSDICSLRIYDEGNYDKIYIDYKGYNTIIPIGIWRFEDEIQDSGIESVI